MNLVFKGSLRPSIHAANSGCIIVLFSTIHFEWWTKQRPIPEVPATFLVLGISLVALFLDAGFGVVSRENKSRLLCFQWCAIQAVLFLLIILWLWGRHAGT